VRKAYEDEFSHSRGFGGIDDVLNVNRVGPVQIPLRPRLKEHSREMDDAIDICAHRRQRSRFVEVGSRGFYFGSPRNCQGKRLFMDEQPQVVRAGNQILG
jgi:hypothetical protein